MDVWLTSFCWTPFDFPHPVNQEVFALLELCHQHEGPVGREVGHPEGRPLREGQSVGQGKRHRGLRRNVLGITPGIGAADVDPLSDAKGRDVGSHGLDNPRGVPAGCVG